MPSDQAKTKGGLVILKRVDIPDRVEPGQGYEVDVVVTNGAFTVGPFDPDHCRSGNVSGYKLRVVVVDAMGERHEIGPACHTITALGGNDETYSVDVRAPEVGDYAEVEAHVELVDSGKQTDPVTARSLLDAEESKEADTPQDDSSDDSSGDENSNDDDDDEKEKENLSWFGDADSDGLVNVIDPEPQNPDVPSGGGPLSLGGQLDKLLLVAGVLALAWAADSGAEVLS